MIAKFPGDCRICKKLILTGQRIIFLRRRAVHEKCALAGVAATVTPKSPEPPRTPYAD